MEIIKAKSQDEFDRLMEYLEKNPELLGKVHAREKELIYKKAY